ncbi:manganese catalase family protein [Saccharibacillus sp. CPCC 101409]|uniref:manganese catalase family protein n=1 Tax=Saccharibacillus sp. CPCC 101409 TaxID=3058041 RepID=UPI0026731B0F|nr:manganese catalase family protein [Saccharibacillus sp. CPCC 101409]MDO3410846.1 manganese catalase family protein [Saccharibacillus sp. CPCC 101409]
MFKRMEEIMIEIPDVEKPDANAAAAVQELLGGKFGEMSTLNNYLFQSFNFRSKEKLRPFYDLVMSITAEELGHVELVSHAIGKIYQGGTKPGDPDKTPLESIKDARFSYPFLAGGQGAMPFDSMGNPWTGANVFNSGNLVEDLLHNFFLEVGARTHKMKVYELTDHPAARAVVGFLLVRGGVHVVAYAKALEVATGVNVTKLIPIPSLDNRKFNEARKYEEKGVHTKLYTWSDNDFGTIDQIWKGTHPEDGSPLEVIAGVPKGVPIPEAPAVDEEFAPGISAEDFKAIAKRLKQAGNISE